ncbi:hypothetical protein [Actinomadura rugatobispora]|uniref:Uncharacterized protein n=1 Tax=Actinomadura rugatobispora TaxID=1994 RepID=A0ABW1A5U1_9ACTN|nr:hypothetical protein GCM10010200_078880 [Actinomadura rugatobispora]
MTVQPFNPADPCARGLHRMPRLSTRSRARTLRHRVIVLAPDPVDAVRHAGGWLFDRAMAGWDALVLTADHADPRPLSILGARPIDFECALSSPVQESWPPQAIAVGADLYGSDARVRRIVLRALDEGRVDVRLWGEDAAADLGDEAGPVLHRLSFAARAFKAQALAAAAVPSGTSEAAEVFRSGAVLRSSGSA